MMAWLEIEESNYRVSLSFDNKNTMYSITHE